MLKNIEIVLSGPGYDHLSKDENLLSGGAPKSKVLPLTSKAYSMRPVWEAVGAAEP